MVKTIDMQTMRHLNLFGNVTKIDTRFCFVYNGAIVFCVPKSLVMKAVGRGGENLRKISSIIRKRVRVISKPRGIEDAKTFILDVINPITFKDFEIKDNEIIITPSGMQNKAALLGRNKQRLSELQDAVRDFFDKELRVV